MTDGRPLTARMERLKTWIRDRTTGGCRMLSEGEACECPLCAVDAVLARLREMEQQYSILEHVVLAVGRVLCDEPVSDFDESYAEVRGVRDLKMQRDGAAIHADAILKEAAERVGKAENKVVELEATVSRLRDEMKEHKKVILGIGIHADS